ncbi:MAG TPA: glucose-6-phosphate dehydrogenase [Acidobacteriota bacterium]|nr:glucose-6-phosphate dehydrogenase [Acidobacteriota bacterium]
MKNSATGAMAAARPGTSKAAEPLARPAGPCVMVIFGATGDLTRRLLMPSLYNLARQQLLPREFAVLGFAVGAKDDDDFRRQIGGALQEGVSAGLERGCAEWLTERLHFIPSDFGDPAGYQALHRRLADIDKQRGTGGNYLFYLATSPAFILDIIGRLSGAGFFSGPSWRRVVVEKPFGRDLESAGSLNRDLMKYLAEDQIYRIDHYLGKETVQNILAFRFANGIFEPIWNRRYIDHIQVTVGETLGVERRGAYYDHAGALRDMVPNHIMQLISLVAMEPPISFAADPVHDEQVKVLHAFQPLKPEDVLANTVRGQYGRPESGAFMPAYRDEPLVAKDSRTETYVALKLMIDSWRWAGVPVYLRTGKRLAKRVTEVSVQFRRAPFVPFRQTAVEQLKPNGLVMHIQPDEGISLCFEAKIPGPIVRLGPVEMKFQYSDYFGRSCQTGYETLLYDCMIGDATLFQRADMVEAGWGVLGPVLEVWANEAPEDFPNYSSGSWGPRSADLLMQRDGREWHRD